MHNIRKPSCMHYTVTYYHDTSCFLMLETILSRQSAVLHMATEYVASTGSTSSLPFPILTAHNLPRQFSTSTQLHVVQCIINE